jgi:hypothetical protein
MPHNDSINQRLRAIQTESPPDYGCGEQLKNEYQAPEAFEEADVSHTNKHCFDTCPACMCRWSEHQGGGFVESPQGSFLYSAGVMGQSDLGCPGHIEYCLMCDAMTVACEMPFSHHHYYHRDTTEYLSEPKESDVKFLVPAPLQAQQSGEGASGGASVNQGLMYKVRRSHGHKQGSLLCPAAFVGAVTRKIHIQKLFLLKEP